MSARESDTQPNKDRVHIWSINVSLWPYFVIPVIFLIGAFVIGSAIFIYFTYKDPSYSGGLWPLIITTFKDIGPIGLSAATIGYLFVGGMEMVKSYLEYRQQKRIEAEDRVRKQVDDAYQRGLKEGREEGKKDDSTNRQTSR